MGTPLFCPSDLSKTRLCEILCNSRPSEITGRRQFSCQYQRISQLENPPFIQSDDILVSVNDTVMLLLCRDSFYCQSTSQLMRGDLAIPSAYDAAPRSAL